MDRERLKRDVERIEKHRQEKAAVAKSEREIFAALKGDGFNCKVVREILKRRAMDDSEGWDAEVATYEAAVQSLELAAERVREGATYEQAATEHNVRKADLHHFVQATAVPETEITEHDPETGEITDRSPASPPLETTVASDVARPFPASERSEIAGGLTLETADRKPPGDSSERDGEGSSSGAAVANLACGGVESRHADEKPSQRACRLDGASQVQDESGEGSRGPSPVAGVAPGPQDPWTPPPFLDRRKVAA